MSILSLKSATPLAKGNVRLVFEHPESPGLLVKVMRPDLVERRHGGRKVWFQGLRRYDPYVVFLREIREFVAAHAALGRAAPFAQVVHGLVETDLGLGLVLEAARDPDGGLAPTIAKLVQHGRFDAGAEAALDQFLTELLESDMVIADLHERNLVYACAQDGSRRFVLIDGLGESNLLPLKSWSRWLNRRSKAKRVARLRKRIAQRVAAFESGNPVP
jgi:PhoP regulatory network protein YrbL